MKSEKNRFLKAKRRKRSEKMGETERGKVHIIKISQ